MHGDIRMINIPLSTLTELLEDVQTEEEEVAEEEEHSQFVWNSICNISCVESLFSFVICEELHFNS
jgi:hypothetical protein